MLTRQQVDRLITPVRGDRILTQQGLSYVPAHEVRAELIRTFGPGNWDSTIHDVTCLYEEEREGKDNKKRWHIAYRVACTLRVRDFDGRPLADFTEYHAEECAPQPNRGEGHALALTSCASYALRRAAIGLGDNMGLHLYDKGRRTPLVKGTIMSAHFWGGEEPEPTEDTAAAEAILTKTLGAKPVEEEVPSE